MEYVDGMDLSKVRKRCAAAKLAIPSRLVAFIGREIAEGLAFAHEVAQGADGRPLHVVHRDLNPANILVSRTGQVKISDFGVAKVLGEASAHETKNVVGKLAYLAPELARGTTFDARVDVFALGLVLWELLCLKQAYARESDAATLSAVVQSRVPPPSLARPDLAGTRWDAFFDRALQPDYEKRYASAREASAALVQILADEGMPKPGELVDFFSQVEALPAPAAVSQSVSTVAGSLEAPTVLEQR
jgi:serine/threonine-protein kinase